MDPPEDVPYFWRNMITPAYTPIHRQFFAKMQAAHPVMVQRFIEKVSILIENSELRRQMGQAGRREVEEGGFSVRRRNPALKRIFDKATRKP
jgi:glycosyltransferase involved in cell wall biosynthesis